ncbi:MAG TPA: saccharopine dehydrogenase C-terminal domain-containing protein [Fimbriimonadaceae bacterium]|nr:saccharopine dehydrogenase C-terminal domain-containing protein [Fimbriimonadaceae bacterium]
MKKVFAVLGAGMQGTAAAYDLAKFADAQVIRMGDVDLHQAEKSSRRVNELIGSAICEPHQVNALEPANLSKFLDGVDVLISCVPYWMHPKIAAVAVQSKTSMVDLGGNTDITMETLKLDDMAKSAGVTLVPDTGLAPGLVNSLGLWLIEHLDTCETVKLYCGVLPQNPKPPFNYKLTFNCEGLVTEYDYQAVVLRNHEIALVDTLTETEELFIDQPELGQMEAFVTSGGTSTAPYTLKDRVTNYEYKTIRFPGHGFLMKIFKDFGFWNEEAIDVKGTKIVPKDVFNAVFGPELAKFVDRDMCAVRGVGMGTKDGQPKTLQIDIFDKEDEVTGFTSMERLTGFSASIYAIEIANGHMPDGAIRYENGMSGTKFVQELERRGIQLTYS